jgi:hypothetical protein
MTLVRICNNDRDWLGLTVSAVAGLGIGVIAGITFGDSLGRFGGERFGRVLRHLRRPVTDEPLDEPEVARQAVLDALAQHPGTRGLEIDVRALGDGIVELTGTAPDEDARELAGTAARAAAGTTVVVNRLLVADGKRSTRQAPSSAS